MYYDLMSTYDDSGICRMSKRIIENGRIKKVSRKISNYRKKSDEFVKELEIGNKFANYIIKDEETNDELLKEAKARFIKSISKKSKRNRHKVRDISTGYYMHCKLNTIIVKNRYIICKILKYSDSVIFDKNDIYEYICLLFQAKKENKVKDFLDVPDVSYITRMLARTGLNIYFM